KIVIPASVKTISQYAFQTCPNLPQVYFTGNPPVPNDPTIFFGDSLVVYYLPGTTGWGASFGGAPAVLWNPQAIAPTNSGGHFGFNITGPTNVTLIVE